MPKFVRKIVKGRDGHTGLWMSLCLEFNDYDLDPAYYHVQFSMEKLLSLIEIKYFITRRFGVFNHRGLEASVRA